MDGNCLAGRSPGDRRAQVQALVAEAAALAVAATPEGPAALATLTLERFHGVTEETRVWLGVVYSVRWLLDPDRSAIGHGLAPRAGG